MWGNYRLSVIVLMGSVGFVVLAKLVLPQPVFILVHKHSTFLLSPNLWINQSWHFADYAFWLFKCRWLSSARRPTERCWWRMAKESSKKMLTEMVKVYLWNLTWLSDDTKKQQWCLWFIDLEQYKKSWTFLILYAIDDVWIPSWLIEPVERQTEMVSSISEALGCDGQTWKPNKLTRNCYPTGIQPRW